MNTRTKIPATVVTGFLGAGKTTLLRHLIATANGRRLAIIVNEFGDIGIDGALLQACAAPGCAEDDIIELANGCICCTVADDFLPTIEKILDRPVPPDHIIIETSGLALPKPLLKAFSWPQIRSRVTVDGVIAVVDAPAIAANRFAADPAAVAAGRAADGSIDHATELAELFADQLQCADLVILNKTDLVDSAALAAILARVRGGMREGAKAVTASYGAMPPAVVLGLAARAEDDLASRPSHHDDEDGEHGHDAFTSFAIDIAPITDPAIFAARVGSLFANFDVLRAKGFLRVAGKDMRLVVQGVGGRVQHYFDRAWRNDDPPCGTLVVIGTSGLAPQPISDALQGC
ncbi:MAG: cobalamin biosynthesis protein CobW [Alphaproteobacteria bacterium]|nr:cobalamin biosynthesis protein CobW [Alphaproteobacteria bacterium]